MGEIAPMFGVRDGPRLVRPEPPDDPGGGKVLGVVPVVPVAPRLDVHPRTQHADALYVGVEGEVGRLEPLVPRPRAEDERDELVVLVVERVRVRDEHVAHVEGEGAAPGAQVLVVGSMRKVQQDTV
ncbi:hypothetical protein PG984_015199 [Apiospora sp. TS-2023a]